MFDLGWSELVVIAIVALIAIGPKELPGVLRALGHWMGKVRRMASEFQDQFKEAMREAEMDDLKKQVDELNTAASDITSYNPVDDINKEFESALDDKPAQEKSSDDIKVDDAPAEPVADERPDPAERADVAPAAAVADEQELAAEEPQKKAAGAGGRPA